MSQTSEQLKRELAQLTVQERAELAHFLLHSLDEETDEDVEAAWDTELTRRMGEIQDGTASGELAGKVFNELREKYS